MTTLHDLHHSSAPIAIGAVGHRQHSNSRARSLSEMSLYSGLDFDPPPPKPLIGSMPSPSFLKADMPPLALPPSSWEKTNTLRSERDFGDFSATNMTATNMTAREDGIDELGLDGFGAAPDLGLTSRDDLNGMLLPPPRTTGRKTAHTTTLERVLSSSLLGFNEREGSNPSLADLAKSSSSPSSAVGAGAGAQGTRSFLTEMVQEEGLPNSVAEEGDARRQASTRASALPNPPPVQQQNLKAMAAHGNNERGVVESSGGGDDDDDDDDFGFVLSLDSEEGESEQQQQQRDTGVAVVTDALPQPPRRQIQQQQQQQQQRSSSISPPLTVGSGCLRVDGSSLFGFTGSSGSLGGGSGSQGSSPGRLSPRGSGSSGSSSVTALSILSGSRPGSLSGSLSSSHSGLSRSLQQASRGGFLDSSEGNGGGGGGRERNSSFGGCGCCGHGGGYSGHGGGGRSSSTSTPPLPTHSSLPLSSPFSMAAEGGHSITRTPPAALAAGLASLSLKVAAAQAAKQHEGSSSSSAAAAAAAAAATAATGVNEVRLGSSAPVDVPAPLLSGGSSPPRLDSKPRMLAGRVVDDSLSPRRPNRRGLPESSLGDSEEWGNESGGAQQSSDEPFAMD